MFLDTNFHPNNVQFYELYKKKELNRKKIKIASVFYSFKLHSPYKVNVFLRIFFTDKKQKKKKKTLKLLLFLETKTVFFVFALIISGEASFNCKCHAMLHFFKRREEQIDLHISETWTCCSEGSDWKWEEVNMLWVIIHFDLYETQETIIILR